MKAVVAQPLRRRLARICLIGLAVAVPWSISLAEVFAAGALVIPLIPPRRPLSRAARWIACLWTIYILWNIAGCLLGPLPKEGLLAGRTLLWGYLPFAAALFFEDDPEGSESRLWFASLTASLLAYGVVDFVRLALHLAHGGVLREFGRMTASQLLLVGSIAAGAFALASEGRRARRLWAGAFAVLSVAMALQFKRGAWASWWIVVASMAAITGRRRAIVLLVAVAIASVFVPSVRHRWAETSAELSADGSSRGALWTTVAPYLLRDYPMGVGPDNTRALLLRSYDEKLAPTISHMHCTPLQILVESGPGGLITWLLWWGSLFFIGIRRWRSTRASPESAVVLAFCGVFLGLFLNGWVEYNFGDTEIALISYVLAGILLASPVPGRSPPAASKTPASRDPQGEGAPRRNPG